MTGAASGFRRFWLASAVSEVGTPVTTVALQVLVVVTLHGTAADVGLVTGARWLPYLVVGLVVGVVADRIRRRPVLVLTDLTRCGLLAAVPLLVHLGVLSIGGLVVFMVFFGLASLINEAAHQPFLPLLVPPGELTPANARLGQTSSAAQTGGPALAGALVSWLGAPLAVLVDAASYLASGLLTATIGVEEVRPAPSATGGRVRRFTAELREGLAWVYGHRTLGAMAVTTHVWFLFFAIATTVYAPFVLRGLGLTPVTLGVTLALTGAGGLLGSSLSGRLGARAGIAGSVVTSHALTAAGVAALALTPAPAGDRVVTSTLLGGGQFLIGIGLGAGNPVEMGYRQAVTPQRLQGRTNTTMRSVNRAAVVVGAPLGGLLADQAGFRPALWLSAAGLAAAAVAVGLSPIRQARASDRAPGPADD